LRNGRSHTDGHGTQTWYKDGKKHQGGDKPAVCEATTRQGVIVEYADGGKAWFKNGKLHRDGDKPAVCEATTRQGVIVEWETGYKAWYKDGVEYVPNWKDIHARVAIKVSNLRCPMLILLKVASRIYCKRSPMDETGLTDYQVTEIISRIRSWSLSRITL